MKRLLQWMLLVVIVLWGVNYQCSAATTTPPTFTTGEATLLSSGQTHLLQVELANTPKQLAYGLMYREQLPSGHGMLFDFGDSNIANMWMKNTYISLDMLFVDEGGTVRHIVEGTTPESEAIISSRYPVRAVLELPAGDVKHYGITVGDSIRHAVFMDEAP